MSCWNGFQYCCTGYALFFFNCIDALCGITLILYAVFLEDHQYAPSWLYQPLLLLGVFLVLAVLISWMGTSIDSCSKTLRCSTWLFALLGVFEFGLALGIAMNGEALTTFLKKYQKEFNISDDELHKLEGHKFIPVYFLTALFLMENMRFWCSGGLIALRKRERVQYETVSQEDMGKDRDLEV